VTGTTCQSEELSVEQLLGNPSDLPVLPQMAAKILEEVRNDDSSPRKLAEYVQKDPVVATAVLRVANSALYGARSEITDLSFAMVRVGLVQVKNLILALVLRSQMADPKVYGSSGADLMSHSLAVALAARLIADEVGIDGNECFLCGLLHDFGRLALIKSIREAEGLSEPDLPPETIGLIDRHHTTAGEILAKRWGLPSVVAAAARHHHQPEACTEGARHVWVISLADALAHHLGLGEDADPSIDIDSHPALAELGMSESALEELKSHIPGLFETTHSAMTT